MTSYKKVCQKKNMSTRETIAKLAYKAIQRFKPVVHANNFIYIYKRTTQDRKQLKAQSNIHGAEKNHFKKAVHIKACFKR